MKEKVAFIVTISHNEGFYWLFLRFAIKFYIRYRVTNFNYTVPCNADCGCESAPLFPICNSNGYAYYSPCHAGCREVSINVALNNEVHGLATTEASWATWLLDRASLISAQSLCLRLRSLYRI